MTLKGSHPMNDQRYRLFWDFYGPVAQHTAAHFATHLNEWFVREGSQHLVIDQGTLDYSPTHTAAFCLVPEALAQQCIAALKPRRGGPDCG